MNDEGLSCPYRTKASHIHTNHTRARWCVLDLVPGVDEIAPYTGYTTKPEAHHHTE